MAFTDCLERPTLRARSACDVPTPRMRPRHRRRLRFDVKGADDLGSGRGARMAAVGAELDGAVERVRDRVAGLVRRDGMDAHQVAANHLAWTVARAEAAGA